MNRMIVYEAIKQILIDRRAQEAGSDRSVKREKDDDEKDSKDVLESDEDLTPEEVNNLIKEAQGKQEAKVKVEEEPSGGRRGKKSRGGGGGAKGKKEVETKDEKKPAIENEESPSSSFAPKDLADLTALLRELESEIS